MPKAIEKITIEDGDRTAEVSVRKSIRARKISIKITPQKKVELVIPTRISIKKATIFLIDNKQWVLNKLASMKNINNIPMKEGANVIIEGKKYIIEHSGKIRGAPLLNDSTLVVSGDKMLIAKKTEKFLKSLAKEKLTKHCDDYADKLGVSFNRISVKDTKTRWGSCSHSRNLSFSWRLIIAPAEVLQYVAAHEMAHILQMNHSPAFWQVVESIFPDYKNSRLWLKKNGHELHSIALQ